MTEVSLEAIRAYREKLKSMTPEEKLWAKMKLNSEFGPFYSPTFRLYQEDATPCTTPAHS